MRFLSPSENPNWPVPPGAVPLTSPVPPDRPPPTVAPGGDGGLSLPQAAHARPLKSRKQTTPPSTAALPAQVAPTRGPRPSTQTTALPGQAASTRGPQPSAASPAQAASTRGARPPALKGAPPVTPKPRPATPRVSAPNARQAHRHQATPAAADGVRPAEAQAQRAEPGAQAGPAELNRFLTRAFERFGPVILARPDLSPAEQLREVEKIDDRMTRVTDLARRLVGLPLIADPPGLAERLTDLARSDIRACLHEMTKVCADLGEPYIAGANDPDIWIGTLDRTIVVLERRGAPEIRMLSGLDGSIDGAAPRRAVRDLTVRDSQAITYGVGNSLHVVHDCPAEPVIEVAELLHYDPATDTEAWFHGVQPLQADAAADLRTRITGSSGVSVGTGNRQESVFVHRIGECAVNLGAVVAVPHVRKAILAYHQAGEQTPEAMADLRRAVRRSASAIDVDALVPDRVVADAAGQAAPQLRGRGPALTIRHGAGVAVGWDIDFTSELRKRVGRPTVR
jgi:hypothetical protein